MSEAVVALETLPRQSSSTGSRFASQSAEIGTVLGLKGLGATYYIVPLGKTAVPFHRHHVADEMFFILSGQGEYRLGKDRIPIKAGDCLGAPAAGAAHQLFNTGTEPLRYLALSNNTNADVTEYPDSGRVRIDVGASGYHRFDGTFKEGGRLTPFGYWEGEDFGEEDDNPSKP